MLRLGEAFVRGPSGCLRKLPTDFMYDGICIASQFALPDSYDTPAHFCEILDGSSIALNCPLKLRKPEVRASCWSSRVPASRMTVPVATMNENGGSVSWQNEVGFTRKIRLVKAKSEACLVQQ